MLRESNIMMNDESKNIDRESNNMKECVMTRKDIERALHEDLIDEIDDCKKYMRMHKAAIENGDEDAAHYLFEMSKDEYTHAKFIKMYLDEHDVELTVEEICEFRVLEEMAEDCFR